ncbi:hypothetical protein [Pontibacter sp. G13]|uniref:hypothetical protein n=1 Tax=Pontibacter sp. G13 TaxID=3074898 RepID=UPI00288AE3CA|nr:hypothetical protein [Pontibacter sp. G13]WNJ16942.1 hypothetical protein RJD25_18980 [Pontibacter sp. G13]
MLKQLFLLVLGLAISAAAFGQSRDWAVGARGGEPSGLNVKKYLGGGHALDLTIGRWGYGWNYGRAYRGGEFRSSTRVTANYLWQSTIPSIRIMDLYYGVGGQMGFSSYYNDNQGRTYRGFAAGLTGVLGVELFIPDTPISLFIDIGPYFELVPAFAWTSFDSGGGIRINF